MKTAIEFSGGKDSLAVMYLLRDRLSDPDVTVYFGDTGNVYPHMRESVANTCKKLGVANLKIITPPVRFDDYQASSGLPSDIVPVEASAPMQPWRKEKATTLLQSSLTCCATLLWLPMQMAVMADGNSLVIRGAKECDGHKGVPHGYEANGVRYESPIWGWSDDDVFSYLREVGAELPEHYEASNNSADCIFCTAFLTHKGAKERIEWTKKRYPELWPTLSSRLRLVKFIIDAERESVDAALSLGGEDV